MWGGRFSSKPSDIMKEINQSISFDQKLYAQDIFGSIAHANMLAQAGIIKQDEAKKIAQRLSILHARLWAITLLPRGLELHNKAQQHLPLK